MHHARLSMFLFVLSSACGMDLPQVEDVEDLRVLAIQTEPPEILFSAAAGLDPANLQVDATFRALVVDPRGGAIDVEWQFCPVQSDDACRDYESLRDQTPDQADSLDAMRAIALSESGVEPESVTLTPEEAATRSAWPFAVPEFSVSAPADLALYHAGTSFFNFTAGAWPSAQLRVTGSDRTVFSTKRLVIGLDDYSPFSDILVDQFGFGVCDPSVALDAQPECLPLRPRAANTNPVFERLEIAFSDQADAPFQPIPRRMDGTYDVPPIEPGEEVRILPVFTEGSFEDYQVLKSNVDTQVLEVADVTEDISVDWFITAGEVQDPLTWPLFTLTLDTVFTAPTEVPASGLVSLWMVARDQRGGSEWLQIEIPIEDGAASRR